jgi:hypothetical protein
MYSASNTDGRQLLLLFHTSALFCRVIAYTYFCFALYFADIELFNMMYLPTSFQVNSTVDWRKMYVEKYM